ncbi:MAG: Fur family transcriptional regulator [Burkholderiaceae bacterium]
MTAHPAAADLTKNQALVMGALTQADGPLSAYTILDQLRDHGFRAPPQVYRALDKLIESGLVHRLESLNAFVACRHSDCEDHKAVVFMICRNCSSVSEIPDNALSKRIKLLAQDVHFALNKSTVELLGICSRCRAS